MDLVLFFMGESGVCSVITQKLQLTTHAAHSVEVLSIDVNFVFGIDGKEASCTEAFFLFLILIHFVRINFVQNYENEIFNIKIKLMYRISKPFPSQFGVRWKMNRNKSRMKSVEQEEGKKKNSKF